MPPALDLTREAALQALIVKLIRDGFVESAHDCSEGGLAIALAECTFDSGGIGVTADVAATWLASADMSWRQRHAVRRIGVAHRRVGGARPSRRRDVGREARACRRARSAASAAIGFRSASTGSR